MCLLLNMPVVFLQAETTRRPDDDILPYLNSTGMRRSKSAKSTSDRSETPEILIYEDSKGRTVKHETAKSSSGTRKYPQEPVDDRYLYSVSVDVEWKFINVFDFCC
jgi:hypothetical protein